MFTHKFSGKITFYVAYVKTKKCPMNRHVGAFKFNFFTQDTEKMFFKKMCANIERLNAHAYIFFWICNILRCVIKQCIHMH
jgi:hypothetical protein